MHLTLSKIDSLAKRSLVQRGVSVVIGPQPQIAPKALDRRRCALSGESLEPLPHEVNELDWKVHASEHKGFPDSRVIDATRDLQVVIRLSGFECDTRRGHVHRGRLWRWTSHQRHRSGQLTLPLESVPHN